ncbi:MAG: CoA pyrophosphatase [Chloroflexi bacterium]|nr:CoA pyrophosphatase [Chloroflexota bacterium]MBU1746071.1 CoA pyrophosphatase [Chloroflexota bacterium]MBU1877469.1 CoA pyrophosphatase [Chloroflexota bacterium]
MTGPIHLEQERERLRLLLAGPLPGRAAQIRMTPRPRPELVDMPPGHRPRPGGVLVLLYPGPDGWHLPLTRRTDTVLNHQGQISLPGGAQEPGEDLLHTALRETAEELGVLVAPAEVLGALTPLFVPPSDFCITPFVAVVERRLTWQPDHREVAEVLDVPLALLRDPATIGQGTWTVPGITVQAPYFQVGEHRVWGATAMILSELLALFDQIPLLLD